MADRSKLGNALKACSQHREVVPCYFVKSAGVMIVTGLTRTHGGAAVIDLGGVIMRTFPSKSGALAAIQSNNSVKD